MKHQLTTLFMACGLTCLFGAVAPAQSYNLASDIPFAFHVGESNCPSGKYSLQRNGSHGYQAIKGVKGSCSLLIGQGSTLNGKSQPKLVFHRYQNQYFLSEIWNGEGTGSRLPMSKREEEAREQAQSPEMATTTLYLMSRR